ncbi:MAG: lytic murein transglycosylase B [Pseudomonadota bacterium]|nr:lytic murein transglycosylase B [Pseudomonadota bacterium]
MTSPLHPIHRPCSLILLALACAGAALAATATAAPAKATNKARAAAHAKAAKAAKPKAAPAKVDYAGEQVNFRAWQAVADFETEMAAKHGFDADALKVLMAQVNYIDAAVQLVKPAPPGKPKNWQAYRERFVEPVRIEAGVAFWNQNAAALARAEQQYGVPAEVIVGIIGVETVYGRNTGRFRVMDVLTTLAFAYPETPNRAARMAFFRGELENTLLLARASAIDPLSLIGSFAGAVGLPQFMPGSIRAYGVDFDGDGQIDLRNSATDAIGSVANFLVQHGWQAGHSGPLAYPATVSPGRAWESFIGQGLAAKFSGAELAAAGALSDAALPADRLFGLIDLQNGAEATEYYLATDNFFAITQYNRSYFYAMSVVELGRAVRIARSVQG